MEMFYNDSSPITEVAPCIFHAKFLTPEYCKYLIQLCEAHNYWRTDLATYNTCDINFEVHYPEVFDQLSNAFTNRFRHNQVQEYLRTEFTDFYTIFAVKYAMGEENVTSLGLPCDDSFLTASIKLSDEYTGAELNFPNQDYDNSECEVGDLILFPGSLTHPHESLELASGTKYSLTMWSKYPDLELHEKTPY